MSSDKHYEIKRMVRTMEAFRVYDKVSPGVKGCLINGQVQFNITSITSEKDVHKAFFQATLNGHICVVRKLLEMSKIDVEVADSPNPAWRALHFASYHGHIDIVKILLEKGASVNAVSKDQDTPLELATVNHKTEVVNFLLKNYKCISNNAINIAIQNGYVDIVKIFVEQGRSCKVLDTALQCAIKNEQVEMCKYLILEYRANCNLQDENGNTPLHLACKKGYTHIINLILINRFANRKLLNCKGLEALHLKTNYMAFINKHSAKELADHWFDCICFGADFKYKIKTRDKPTTFAIGDLIQMVDSSLKDLRDGKVPEGVYSNKEERDHARSLALSLSRNRVLYPVARQLFYLIQSFVTFKTQKNLFSHLTKISTSMKQWYPQFLDTEM